MSVLTSSVEQCEAGGRERHQCGLHLQQQRRARNHCHAGGAHPHEARGAVTVRSRVGCDAVTGVTDGVAVKKMCNSEKYSSVMG